MAIGAKMNPRQSAMGMMAPLIYAIPEIAVRTLTAGKESPGMTLSRKLTFLFAASSSA
jgi:hypothetical protein